MIHFSKVCKNTSLSVYGYSSFPVVYHSNEENKKIYKQNYPQKFFVCEFSES